MDKQTSLNLTDLLAELETLKDPQRALGSLRYFKTGPGEYAEGDLFLGIEILAQKRLSKKYSNLNLSDLQRLLASKYHDHRSLALSILTLQYAKNKDLQTKEKIYNFYLKNTKNINNWDLVDISAPHIVGQYLLDKPNRKILYQLAKSKNLWEKRIAIITTLTLIKNQDFKDTLAIAEILINDDHDLIHKAVGWMLREVGKKDQTVEEKFLQKHYQTMPRTMLRYAIEKFETKKRDFYLGR